MNTGQLWFHKCKHPERYQPQGLVPESRNPCWIAFNTGLSHQFPCNGDIVPFHQPQFMKPRSDIDAPSYREWLLTWWYQWQLLMVLP